MLYVYLNKAQTFRSSALGETKATEDQAACASTFPGTTTPAILRRDPNNSGLMAVFGRAHISFCLFLLFRATPAAHGSSQPRDRIRATAMHLWPTPQLIAVPILNLLSEARDQTRILAVPGSDSILLGHKADFGRAHISTSSFTRLFNR